MKVDPALFPQYAWSGSTIEYHRKQIRDFHGFPTITVGDEDKLTGWLAGEICRRCRGTGCGRRSRPGAARTRSSRHAGAGRAAAGRGRGDGATAGDRPAGDLPGDGHPDAGQHHPRGEREREGVQHPGPDQVARAPTPTTTGADCPSLAAVTFRSSNTAFQPVIDALALLDRYKDPEEARRNPDHDLPPPSAAGFCCACTGWARTWGSSESPTGWPPQVAQDADTEMALRRTRRLFISRDNLRSAIRTVVDKTLEVREIKLWGPGTSCASDSPQVRIVVGELHDRVAPAVRRPGDHGALARRVAVGASTPRSPAQTPPRSPP